MVVGDLPDQDQRRLPCCAIQRTELLDLRISEEPLPTTEVRQLGVYGRGNTAFIAVDMGRNCFMCRAGPGSCDLRAQHFRTKEGQETTKETDGVSSVVNDGCCKAPIMQLAWGG